MGKKSVNGKTGWRKWSVLSSQGILESTAESEQNLFKKCTQRPSSGKRKQQVLMSIYWLLLCLVCAPVSAMACWDT